MARLCLYLQLHQPFRLEEFSLFELGHSTEYFNHHSIDINKQVFVKVAAKSYLPMLALLYRLVKQHPEFVLAISCSGTFLAQAQRYQPQIITWLKKLVKTGQVEILAETYYHSLASLYSVPEFIRQVHQHGQLIKTLFGLKPTVFRNSELIYDNRIGQIISDLGYQVTLVEGVDRYLGDCTMTQPARHIKNDLRLLLKHSQLSDDIAFRFSDPNWSEYPLTVAKYLNWLNAYQPTDLINLFLDFETFGEHHWRTSGIFQFFEKLVETIIQTENHIFIQPSDLSRQVRQLPRYDVPQPISWADTERDLTAWTGNDLQKDSLRALYSLADRVMAQKSKQILDTWGKLQTSDHFYYMCTKWASDGDIHAYFSPFPSPFEAYRQYSVVLSAFAGSLK